MTSDQRTALPDSARTNGATPNPWWSNAVVYQIYPRSFQDTSGDGLGDVKGITSRLDYLAELGVDVLWLSPVYKSPQDDNGYDIADYQAIDPLFGTMDDVDELLAEAHKRGLKIIMDLVVNHTSDEHAWFQASRNKDDEHADWYWWRPAREGFEPGTKGAEPNQWGSYFGGSAWTYDETRGEYFFHQYSPKQPDLNWENPAVRQAIYDMMNWWMDRGIDGFRMDVITQISKTTDANGKLPGEPGSEIADGPVEEEGYSSPFPFCSNGPRLDEFLAEMRREVFANRDGFFTVGEAPGVPPTHAAAITNPANAELDMLFIFDHVDIDHSPNSKWEIKPFEVAKLRDKLAEQQNAVREAGWTSLFFCNHDQPRVVSRWGDDSTNESRRASAKAFALLLHMHRGTPYIFQGEELGMTNAHFTSLDQYRDLEALNAYRQRVQEAKVQSSDSMMEALAHIGRDNARTPMQWDSSKYAGFTAADSTTEPWISVNPNHDTINVENEVGDPQSVYSFYKKLIALRHENAVVAAGDWQLVDANDASVYAFTRTLDEKKLLVMVNLTKDAAAVPAESAALLADSPNASVLIATHDIDAAPAELKPWEGVVIEL